MLVAFVALDEGERLDFSFVFPELPVVAVHWHGVRQLNNNAYDGVPVVTLRVLSHRALL